MVDILLYFFQITRHTIEIICQCSGISHELGFGCGTVGILQECLQSGDHQLIEVRLEPGALTVIIKIRLQLLHVILFHVIFAKQCIVIPISSVIEFIPYTLNGQSLYTGTGTAIGLEHPQRIGGLLCHLLSAVAFRLYIGDIIGSGIHGSIAGQKSRICNI